MAKNGALMIDGTDIGSVYGVLVSEGGFASLVQWPSLKTPESNDWFEEEGLEVDLSSPVLSSRDVSMEFILANGHNLSGFLDFLAAKTFYSVYSSDLGMTFRLRWVSCTKVDTVNGEIGKATLTFADDFPLWGYTRSLAAVTVADSGITLDGTDIASYGVIVLQGTGDSFRTVASAKTPLRRNVDSLGGSITDGVKDGDLTPETGSAYDNPILKRGSKVLSIKCLMAKMTASQFASNWRCLLYDLCQSGARAVAGFGKTLSCYYNSCQVTRFYSATGGLWCEFTVNLTVVG